jgi:large subunit ribosomal protein L23
MAELHVYEVLRRPVITEKATALNEDLGKYVFEVAAGANKIQVRDAIEFIYDVEVDKVNVMVMPAKRGRRGRKWYMRSRQWKKAVVTLKPGHTINLFDV